VITLAAAGYFEGFLSGIAERLIMTARSSKPSTSG
jgi:hypothetical protein